MLIIIGTRLSRKKLGYVADFCVFCRDIRKVRLDRLQMYKHIYYINYRPVEGPWNMQKCMECGGENAVEVVNFTKTLKRPDADIEEFIRETNPSIRKFYNERLLLEKEVELAPLKLSQEVRELLIKEPFEVLAPQVEQTYHSGINIDWKIMLIMLIGTIFTIIMFCVTSSYEKTASHSDLWIASWVIALLSFIAVIISMGFESRRRIKKKYLGLLVRALNPLKPKEEELHKITDFYKITRAIIGKKWLFRELIKRLERAESNKPIHTTNTTNPKNLAPQKSVFNSDVKKGDYVKAIKGIKK
jgi:hypothetical protein